MPRLALALIALAALFTAPATASAAQEGDLDGSFGAQGSVALMPGDSSFEVFDAATDAQGRVVAVGGSDGSMAVARILPDGTLDPSFDGDGFKTVASQGPSAGGQRARSVAIDPASGAIILFGDVHASSGPSANHDLVLARLTSAGVTDASFDGPDGNGNGVFRLSFDPMDSADEVLPGDNGKLILGAMIGGNQAGNKIRVIQLNQNGTLDTANFGSPNGYADIQYTTTSGSFVEGMARQDDGKIVVSGSINGTATYAVARVTAAGALDTTFNSAGTIPGVARPQLPPNFRSARAFDVEIADDGIVVAGVAQSSIDSDDDPMLAKLTFAGVPDTSFGSVNGFRIIPAGAKSDSSTFNGLEILSDGRLLASGTVGPVTGRDQMLARFSAEGSLDTGFSGATDGLVRSGAAINEFNYELSLANGIAYMTGQGYDGGPNNIAATAVCAEVPPACPVPAAPDSLEVQPASGSNENLPKVKGTIPAGPAATSVELYATADCSGNAVATGSAAEFTGAGIEVPVEDNTTTTFRATATGANGSSACSTAAVSYQEITPASVALMGTNPPSGSNENNPRVHGVASLADTVSIYADAECAGTPLATGSKAEFTGLGIQVSVADNSTTTFYAKATGPGGDSGCVGGYQYTEVTPPVTNPGDGVAPLVPAPAAPKCKKAKKKKGAKKGKCKRRKPKRR